MSPPILLITGASGYLGSQIIRWATTWVTHGTYLHHEPRAFPPFQAHRCDLRDQEAVTALIATIRPCAIIHTACSNQNQENLDSIIPAAKNLATAAHQFHARFIHVSTDLIFDGNHPPYREDASPQPLTEYGAAKAQAEAVVLTHNPNALIVRPSLIYGIDPLDHQTRWLLKGIEDHQVVRLFTDEIRSPIWVKTLSLALLELAEQSVAGVLHLAGSQALTRWELGQAILKMLHTPMPSTVIPSTIQESGLVRPKDLTLDITKARQLLNTPLLSVAEVKALLASAPTPPFPSAIPHE